MKLTNGTSGNSGLIQVYFGGLWGRVCRDYWTHFDHLAANVVCRQLEHTGGVAVSAERLFARTGGLVWLNDVTCNGDEDHLGECQNYGWGTTSRHCTSGVYDAGGICYEGRHLHMTPMVWGVHVNKACERARELPFDIYWKGAEELAEKSLLPIFYIKNCFSPVLDKIT